MPLPRLPGQAAEKEALTVTVGGLNIDEFCQKPVTEALDFMERRQPGARAPTRGSISCGYWRRAEHPLSGAKNARRNPT